MMPKEIYRSIVFLSYMKNNVFMRDLEQNIDFIQ